MTTNDHIAAIKKHLKAIEAEMQPKREPKRYLVIPVEGDCDSPELLTYREAMRINPALRYCSYNVFNDVIATVFDRIASQGKIITTNEE